MSETADKAAARRRRGRRPAGWALGLPAAGLVCVAAAIWLTPGIERDIRRAALRAAEQAEGAGAAQGGLRVEVDGRDVRIVSDQPLGDDQRARTEETLRRIRGVRTASVDVSKPAPMSPFELVIRRTENALSFSGGVPAAGLRSALVARAGRLVPAEAVDDRLRIATGAPDSFAEAADWLMGLVEKVASGEATLSGRSVRLRLEAPDPPSYAAIRASLASPPPGFELAAIEIVPPLVSAFTWTARRGRAEIVLSGNVPSEEMRARLGGLVAQTMPKLAFRDEMRTARGLDAGVDLAAVAQAALSGLAALQSGAAELAGSRFSLSGEGVAKAKIQALERSLRAALPSRVEVRDVSVRVVPASPFRFSATRSGGRLVLAGFVPDEGQRGTLASLAASRFPGERIVDDRDAADGAPPGFTEAAKVALETLTNLAEGEASLTDREVVVQGRVIYAQLAARLRDSFPSLLPAGWTGRIALDPVTPERALDPIQCGDLLAEASQRHPIRFEPGKPEPTTSSKDAFLATADVIRRCGDVGVRVVHRIAGRGDPEAARTLAGRRAEVVAEVLGKLAKGSKLSPEGVVAPQSSAEAADRTEFSVASR